MNKAAHPFSSFGVSDDLLETLEVLEDPGLAEALAPRPFEAFVKAEMGYVNVYLDPCHECFVRIASTHLGIDKDGILGLACTETCHDAELFIPLDRFGSWHAEVPRDWQGEYPSRGDVDSMRFVLREEIAALERKLAGPGPLVSDIATPELLERMAPYPVPGDLDIACEEEIFEVYEGLPYLIKLTARGEGGPVTHSGYITGLHRAYDGRLGFTFEADKGHQPIPFEAVLRWQLIGDIPETDYWDEDLAKSGGRAELEEVFLEETKSMSGIYPSYIEQNNWHPSLSWDDYLEPWRLSRLALDHDDRDWADGAETRIYLALAQDLPEAIDSVATRVGGALWAARRGDNAARVAWALRFVGFPITDDMLVRAAESLDSADSARVQSSALFVACGGGSATPETLRRLTLLQKNCPVPRFW